jgi:hypothetical protein
MCGWVSTGEPHIAIPAVTATFENCSQRATAEADRDAGAHAVRRSMTVRSHR